MGVFAGNNGVKKIIVYGLVITNSQSTYAYTYIFKTFFEIIGSKPEVIITDEEKAIFYAIKNMKK